MTNIKTLLATLVLLSWVSVAKAQNSQIDDLMTKAHNIGLFNGNVLVIQKGKTIYESSFGYADGAKTRQLDKNFLFNIGSIGKEFNGVAIMMLKEQGKLGLDDKVSKYLPELPAWAAKISIKNLLQYTSGLPDVKWQTIKSDADIMNDMKQLTALNSEPGTHYSYNNSNVFLQRRIVEKISGMGFNKFVEQNILLPCQMKASEVDPDMGKANVAVSFNNDRVQSPRQFAYVMTGWTSVTAHDLYQWNQCLHDFKIISKPSILEILKPFAPNKQSSLGGGTIDNGEIITHEHHGSSADFEALMYTDVTKDISVILLTNNMNFKVFDLKDAILNILDHKPYVVPKKSLLTVLRKSLDTQTIEETLVQYDNLKKTQSEVISFEEPELNSIGYFLLGKKRFEDAVKVFELNVKLFPESANAYDSLAEGYYNTGNKALALQNYKKSLSLDPKNNGAKEMIEKIEKGN
jgi:CubicO group peptidase (beta-lactamase class C family)